MVRERLIILLLSWLAASWGLGVEPGGEEAWCIETKEQFGIEPGRSFGSLPATQHKAYLNARCYRFFCEPHELAGKGVFPCIPLKQKEKQTESEG